MTLQFIIGERLNQGATYRPTRVFIAVKKKDERVIRQITEEQTEKLAELTKSGALNGEDPAYLDVNLLRDERKGQTHKTIEWLISTVQKFTPYPLSIDTDSPFLLMDCLDVYDYAKANGKQPILNAIRVPNSDIADAVDKLLKIRGHKPYKVIISCTMDVSQEDRICPAKSYQRKLVVAKKLIEMMRSYGFQDHEIIVDPGLSGVAICSNSAKACLKTIAMLKQDSNYENIESTLGVSQLVHRPGFRRNRKVIQAYLVALEGAGLTSAIMDPRDYGVDFDPEGVEAKFVDELLRFPCTNRDCTTDSSTNDCWDKHLALYYKFEQISVRCK